ncbi:MAG: translation initiation factor IF-2, partial [Waterburya sp.]
MNNGKVRIYELSKELNLDNKDIKEICEQLNIAVKSHSSTITADDAVRVRSLAEKSPRTENNHDTPKDSQQKGNNALNAPAKRKQQILAVHHRTDNPNSSSSPQTPNLNGQSPRLVSPPSRPKAPNSGVVQGKSLGAPKPSSQSESTGGGDYIVKSAADNNAESSPKANALQPNRLTVPPSRPQGKKSASRNLIQSPIKPKVRSVEQPQSKPEELEPEEKKKKVIAPLPKLNQRPQKIQAVAKVAPKDEVEEEELVENLDGDDVETDDLEVKKVTRLKRPAPPKKVKEWENEEDDESKQAKLGKGKAAKKRRGPKPLLDDEDFDEADANAIQINEAFSLSTARPAKPKSMQQAPVATANKKPRKPSFKTEKTQKTERQSKGKVVPTLSESIILTDNLTVRDLAERLNTPETDIIRSLFFKGIPVNITQTLDLETARSVAEELGVIVETPEEKSAATKETEMLDANDLENLQPRPPVVTIMGHVDHGKTTLLDSIRKSTVASGEAGGITQHIGAYHVDVEHNGKQQQIVFLDTPGHEAFTAMRARGTRVTDIAVLVVAADDGVQPQTKEAISHAKAAEVPLIVAINKVDKPESNPDRIKQELTEQGLVPEDWGGDTTMVHVSALKGDNLEELLEMILLVAEVEELSANPNRAAKGTVIEANLDRNRGPVATLLVQNGTLRVGDSIVAGSVLGRVRAMVDD